MIPSFKTVGNQTITGSGDIPLPVIPTFKTIDGEPILGEGNLEISKPKCFERFKSITFR